MQVVDEEVVEETTEYEYDDKGQVTKTKRTRIVKQKPRRLPYQAVWGTNIDANDDKKYHPAYEGPFGGTPY